MYIQACSKKTHRASWGLAGDGSSMSPCSVSVRQAVIEHNNKYIQTCSKIDPPGNKLNLPFLGGVMPPPLSPKTKLTSTLPPHCGFCFREFGFQIGLLTCVSTLCWGEGGGPTEHPRKKKVKFVARLTEQTGALQGMGAACPHIRLPSAWQS